MIIALDFDGTYTEDPDSWDGFINDFRLSGHTIYCVTMRHPYESDPLLDRLSGVVDDVFYTGRQAKLNYMRSMGVNITVWIDDNPLWLYDDG